MITNYEHLRAPDPLSQTGSETLEIILSSRSNIQRLETDIGQFSCSFNPSKNADEFSLLIYYLISGLEVVAIKNMSP